MKTLAKLAAGGLAALALLPGCATSDNPNEGGLFGYLQHGSSGYQRRLDERQERLAILQHDTAEEQSRTESLTRRQTNARATISRLSNLKERAKGLGSAALSGRINQIERSGDVSEADIARLEAEIRELKRKAAGVGQ
jgi:chromosome segregation ATPase